ncbi:S26 family signal peptidase [Aeoliella sp. SH292]|uniref:S26 family signal peptidase n=1 Tax=Aeoliella sp. SH292 TaxID=3454464 RepID=UPI003F9DBD56
MRNASPTSRPLLYAWLRTIVVVAVAMVAIETFVVMGVVMPTRIEGSSMAPALLGAHADVACPRCERSFEVADDQIPRSHQFWCPDCGERFASKVKFIEPGERMWIDRAGVAVANPDRYAIVVARSPVEATSLCIKRVLALPGEHVDFDRGDLLIDGKIARKSFEDQMRVRQLVHEERNALRQWSSEDKTSWQWSPSPAWHHRGPSTSLTFSPANASPVTDELATNQTLPATPHEVTDLMVTCDLTLEPKATLTFVTKFPNGQRLSRTIREPGECSAVWSLFDQQVMLAIDGNVVWSEPHSGPWSGPPRLSLLAEGQVEVRDLTVWRDIYYYTRPVDRWPAEGMRLGAGHYFVAGDNQAVSDDCRSWPGHALPRELLIGTPIGVK